MVVIFATTKKMRSFYDTINYYFTEMSSTPSTIKSRRSSLRFFGDKHPVTYKTEFEEGSATLANISTSGAALEEATPALTMNEKILLNLELFDTENPVEIQAIVVRSEAKLHFVQFMGITSEVKREILKFFVHRARLENN